MCTFYMFHMFRLGRFLNVRLIPDALSACMQIVNCWCNRHLESCWKHHHNCLCIFYVPADILEGNLNTQFVCVDMPVPPQEPHCQGRNFHHRSDGGRCRGHWGHCRRPAGCHCHGECPAVTSHSGIREKLKGMFWYRHTGINRSRLVVFAV